MRRAGRQLGASPVLIGAVTLLVAIVAVFISYSANNGLPFVPSYQLKAEVPNGAKLVKGNEVRAGGFRVGIVQDIKSGRRTVTARSAPSRCSTCRLDKQIEPLSVDSTLSVRPRSALGLKYVELIPGRSKETYQNGDTIPLARASENAPELEDVLSTFAAEDARRRARLAGGLRQLDRRPRPGDQRHDPRARAVHALPAAGDAQPVRAGDTELRNFFPGLGAAAAQAAPVAQIQARWFGEMATTFAAISRDPQALRETIEESPPTLEAATESFRVQTPFLARFASVSRDLQPGTALLPQHAAAGERRAPGGRAGLPRDAGARPGARGPVPAPLEDLGDNPSTLLALQATCARRCR